MHVPSAASHSQSAQAGVGGSRHRSRGHPSSCPRGREGGGQAAEWGRALTKEKALNKDWEGVLLFFREEHILLRSRSEEKTGWEAAFLLAIIPGTGVKILWGLVS